ncbi:MAG TPA: 16S rRNA (cytosine(967)-C(5))-methyltransferase RsmB [Vicinamibacterales bacterium]|nr:16S rRNA (cytosine(967)-C(5))-methyltransferase RsmB [Vicinamibacterales bacterium]
MIAPARMAAIDALRLIDDEGVDLGAAVARGRERLADERDHALLLELVSGTLRMRAALDYQLGQRVKRPLPRLDAAVLRVLRLSAFQLLYLSRLPASAVINDAVELTRRSGKSSASGLCNAVLRALSRDRDQLTWPPRDSRLEYLSVVHSHPVWLVQRWLERYGDAETERWLQFNNVPAAMCLAVNRRMTDRDALATELAAAGITTQPTARASSGLLVTDGRPLRMAAFAEGRFVVQDEASQLIGELAAGYRGTVTLDLCASPGGKTLALSATAARVVACDVRSARIRLLQRTLSRCRVDNARIVHVAADGALPFRPETFDTVLIDAPCSGLGTVRRDPDIRWKRAPQDLHQFAQAQLALVHRAADLVARGGTLIYATCSSEPEENQDVVAAFRGDRLDFAEERVHQTLPFRDDLEAFFGAVLRRAV